MAAPWAAPVPELGSQAAVALVTGASGGIGRACARSLARMGYAIAAHFYRHGERAEALIRELRVEGRTAEAFQADLSLPTGGRELVQTVARQMGRIDVLVQSTGVAQIRAVEDISEEEWDAVEAANLRGVFFTAQATFRLMREQGGGRIINIASTAGVMGGFFIGAHYAASKGGVLTLTKSLARAGAPYRILVNCVAPGLIDTEMSRHYPPDLVQDLVASIPLRRMGSPDEIGGPVAFLASPAASYITGATLYVNSGSHMA